MNPLVELTLAVLLAAGAVYFVLLPIIRPVTPRRGEGGVEGGDEGEGEDSEDDSSPRAVALRALKEIEFDRATGKLSDADYDELKNKYTALAVETYREAGSGKREATAPHRTAHPPFLISHPPCPTHGPRTEPGAQFCGECGRRLSSAHGFCSRCGAALEAEAHFCNACGNRVAA